MNKKFLKGITLVLSSAFLFSTGVAMAGCNNDEGPGKSVKINFWGYGDDNETQVFKSLVDQFNELYDGEVFVNYDPRPNKQYTDAITQALRASRSNVDVLYIDDADIKSYAELGFLEPLDAYIEKSTEIDRDNMWESSLNRYLYDVNTTTQNGPDAHYWGIPKDVGPTVIYYNETQFNQAGVNVISVAAKDLNAFNAGGGDSRGQTKASLGITGEVKEKGYFELDGKKWFNNQVPMSWNECVTLAQLVMGDQRTNRKNANHYGYFTEWWFNYGWSVGGDCVEYIPDDDASLNGGYWEFTIMEDTPNYIVADGAEPFTVNGNTYQPGEIISWNDKLADVKAANKTIASAVASAAAAGQLNELPSQRDAFVEFVRVGQNANTLVDGDMYGYGICPSPVVIGGDEGKTNAFTAGDLAMLVDGRWNVVNFRKRLGAEPGRADLSKGEFEWDVAPLPMYKEYDAEGNVTMHGVEAGHSGSVAIAINAKSSKKEAAWKFLEYIGGKTGQAAQAESGFAIPSQKDLANTEVFLQTAQNPRNSIVFVRAAQFETPGDWWYLKNKKWIDPWAGVLNGDVRNGRKTLTQFQNSAEFTSTNAILLDYTKK